MKIISKFSIWNLGLGIWNLKISVLLFLFISFILTPSFSQSQFLTLNREYNLWLERQLNNKENFAHTSFKPYIESAVGYDSLQTSDTAYYKRKTYQKLFVRKLKSESLIVIDSDEFHLTIDPLFKFQYGSDFADTSNRKIYTNTRGILVRANIGKKISLQSSFLENQSFFPQYVDDFVKTYGVVPGNGRVKPFKKTGYDYAMASGYVSFSPVKSLNIQFGHDKNFIGDGYRSLLLSDNAFNYPFLKITSSFLKNRIQYTNLYTQLSTLNRIPAASTPEALFIPKYGTFNFLSFIPWKHLHIGLFEGVIWQRWDSAGTKPFDWNFINPLIFVNTAIYGLNGKQNAIAGLNLKLKILKGFFFYAQLMMDNAQTKEGYQFGIKSFDLFTLKNLNIQIEYNKVQPDTYIHSTKSQSYFHYNQPLAHPLGYGFEEIIAIIDYRWRDFFVSGKYNFSINTLLIQDYQVGYTVNRQTNTNIYAGFMDRWRRTNSFFNSPMYAIPDSRTQLFYFGMRTSLYNQYFDF